MAHRSLCGAAPRFSRNKLLPPTTDRRKCTTQSAGAIRTCTERPIVSTPFLPFLTGCAGMLQGNVQRGNTGGDADGGDLEGGGRVQHRNPLFRLFNASGESPRGRGNSFGSDHQPGLSDQRSPLGAANAGLGQLPRAWAPQRAPQRSPRSLRGMFACLPGAVRRPLALTLRGVARCDRACDTPTDTTRRAACESDHNAFSSGIDALEQFAVCGPAIAHLAVVPPPPPHR